MSRGRKKKYTQEDQEEILHDIEKTHNTNVLNGINVKLKAKTENQKKLMNLIKEKDIIVCSGGPGCGKTYVACAMALDALKNNPKIKQIVLVKSVTTLKDEEVGFLKGTLKEKMEPFMFSFYYNLEKIIGKTLLEQLKLNGYIVEMPIAYMRGINIDNAFIIIDESQNIILDNMRTITTRLGEDSKMVILGDVEQIDTKKKNESSLEIVIKHFIDADPQIGGMSFTDDDIVRHRLVQVLERIFKNIKEDLKTK